MATWPASLPQQFESDGLREQAIDILVRSPVDAGPPKVRPRYSGEPVGITGTMILTYAQRATLETFYRATLGFGTDAFEWAHPITQGSVSVNFASRPGYAPVAPGHVRVSLSLIIWP